MDDSQNACLKTSHVKLQCNAISVKVEKLAAGTALRCGTVHVGKARRNRRRAEVTPGRDPWRGGAGSGQEERRAEFRKRWEKGFQGGEETPGAQRAGKQGSREAVDACPHCLRLGRGTSAAHPDRSSRGTMAWEGEAG